MERLEGGEIAGREEAAILAPTIAAFYEATRLHASCAIPRLEHRFSSSIAS